VISVESISKRYMTLHGPGDWVLRDVSFQIPSGVSVGVVGPNGAGKSTLLRVVGGVDRPNRGRVVRDCSVSWPMGLGAGLQGSLTGRQNAKFVCRVHGREEDIPALIENVQEFAELGNAFDRPVKTYSSGMKSRLQFGLSLVFNFDVYISDEITAVGDKRFKRKAREAFKDLLRSSSIIMVSHDEGTLKEFCSAGVYIQNQAAHWFDDIDDALTAYNSER
jgi:capsular polysaccharide transport system ATP-binding protein